MRIMHLSSEYPPSQVFGLGRAVHDLAVAQAALGHEVRVITNSLGGRDQDAQVEGVGVHRISFPPPPKPPDDTMAVTQFNLSVIAAATRVVQQGAAAPDILHVHDWLTVLSGRMLRWLHPAARLVATIHDTARGKYFGQLSPAQQYMAHLERYIGQEAEAVICCSQHVREELVQQYHVAPERIALVPCGVAADQFAVRGDLAGFRRVFAAPEDRLVLYVGRLDQEKGLPVLLQAFAHVWTVEPRARLVLAGKGVLQEELQRRAAELGVGERVSFVGYVTGDALAGVYRTAEVLTVPSLYEPFGMVALEGMVCGIPVVVADTGGLREIVTDGVTGLRVPPGDAPALAQALLRVLSDEALASRLGQTGQQHAHQAYNWTDLARQTVAVYAACLTERPAAAL
jgi:glycogen(starch) synthase